MRERELGDREEWENERGEGMRARAGEPERWGKRKMREGKTRSDAIIGPILSIELIFSIDR